MTAETYYNALRYSLIQQIAAIKAKHRTPYQGEVWDNYSLRWELLDRIEIFQPEGFDTEQKQEETLSFIISTLQEDYVGDVKNPPDKSKIEEIFKQIRKQLKIDLKKAATFPEVPYRRRLGKEEWENVCKRFEEELKADRRFLDPYNSQVFDNRLVSFIKQETDNVYYVSLISHYYAYELSTKWFEEMFQYDGCFWIDKDFTWALYAEPNGYPETYGRI
jgi:hypothetical protein